MPNYVYLNGKIIPYEEAKIGIEDRGYQFADGVYEVVAIYRGEPFYLDKHWQRLASSCRELDINIPDLDNLKEEALKLYKKSGFKDGKLYVQITRGIAGRTHDYPENLRPQIVMKVTELKGKPQEYYQQGVKAITVPDERWSRCYIKSIALLPNILAKKQATRADAYEAIQIRDGFITEGTHTNLFIVKGGNIYTPPATNYILNGITRQVIISENVVKEKSISLNELYQADEVFLTGTTTEIMPVIKIDGKKIGKGKPGEVTLETRKKYRKLLPY